MSRERDADLVALDDALQALVVVHPRKSQVVELRFFGGLSIEETAGSARSTSRPRAPRPSARNSTMRWRSCTPSSFRTRLSASTTCCKPNSSCGMAEWGVAMSIWGNPFGGLRSPKTLQDGLAASEKAQAIGAKTDREREYIGAVALLYKDAGTLDQHARTSAYEGAMEQLYVRYTADLEAAAFYALAVDQDALPTDKTYANQLKAAAILEKLYKVEPDHPGAPAA